MPILVIAEHDNTHLKPATLATVAAAAKLGGEIHVLVVGHNCQTVLQEAQQVMHVTMVQSADDAAYANFLAENIAPLVVNIGTHYSHILSPATTFGKDILPRVAALLDVAQISDVLEIVDATTFKRPIYAGNVIATVTSTDAIKVMTIRTTAFEKVAAQGGNALVSPLAPLAAHERVAFVSKQETVSARPELTSARVVVSGGRGMGSAANFVLIEAVADKLHAAIGASRAAVDAGYVPNDYQVGQTGKIVAPELYIAVGISGAIQHLAGMKDSKVIVAINKDENAPIFDVADVGLVADLFEALPELEKLL